MYCCLLSDISTIKLIDKGQNICLFVLQADHSHSLCVQFPFNSQQQANLHVHLIVSNAFQFTRVKQCSLRIGDAMSTSQNNAYRISTLFSRKMSLILTVYDMVYNVLNLWKTCQNVERTGLNLLERCTILRWTNVVTLGWTGPSIMERIKKRLTVYDI